MSLALKRKVFKFYKFIICDSLNGINLSSPSQHIPLIKNCINAPLKESKGRLCGVYLTRAEFYPVVTFAATIFRSVR